MVDRTVFPKCPHFIDYRYPHSTTDTNCRYGIEHRGVCVQHIGLCRFGHFGDASRQLLHQREFSNARQRAIGAAGGGGTEKPQSLHTIFRGRAGPLLRTGQVQRFPPQRALCPQNRQCAEGVPAVQRNRMVQNVQDPHDATVLTQGPRRGAGQENSVGSPA